MISTLKKKLNKKGFTLAELLIVVAIIAILVAIAIPVFSTQLSKAKSAVDDANMRSAESMAASAYLLEADSKTAGKTYYYAVVKDSNGNLALAAGATGVTTYDTATAAEADADEIGQVVSTQKIIVAVKDGSAKATLTSVSSD